jgi:hypothetical protein
MATRRLVAAIALMFLLSAAVRPAHAWMFHEHRAITATAISHLDGQQTEILKRLWEETRAGHEGRFCPEPVVPQLEEKPTCLDFAAWPPTGGDHSCSYKELLATVSDSDWIMEVVGIAARAERELGEATNERQRNSADVRSSLSIARVDSAMTSRAAGNNGHFLLERDGNDLTKYLVSATRGGAPPNGIGIYARNHLAALRLAAAWGGPDLTPEDRAALARAALAREAFALHYLEDAFAAGHVAGCWGRPAERLGTHDYYNAHGLETMTWAGTNVILLGDRHMRPEDLKRAAATIQASLAQFLEAARSGSELAVAVSSLSLEEAGDPTPFNACRAKEFPDWSVPESLRAIVRNVVEGTPMPGRGPGIASLPRSHAEIGAFISWVSGARVGVLDAPFEEDKSGTYVDGEVFIGLRAGIGLDALTGRTGDGLFFLQLGVANRQEKGPYLSEFSPDDSIPGRTGVQLRMRAPFYIVPLDLFLAAPVLALTSPKTLKGMAITAANGGVIPWQRAMPVGEEGRFQFVLGREFCVTFHGQWGSDHYTMLVPISPGSPPEPQDVEVRSVEWEFPVLEYRAFRTFAGRQAYTMIMQVGAGFDRPEEATVVDYPNAPAPDLRTRHFIFWRLTFDVRHYF